MLQQPFVLQDLPFNIEASVGGALFPGDATDVDSLKSYSPADLTLERIDELVDALVRADVLPT